MSDAQILIAVMTGLVVAGVYALCDDHSWVGLIVYCAIAAILAYILTGSFA